MISSTQQSIEIVRCDNGFVVEWKDERKQPDSSKDDGGAWYWNTRGVKVFATKKALDEFLDKFFRAA